MNMWMHMWGYRTTYPCIHPCNFRTSKPKFRREEATLHHSVPSTVHFLDGCPKLIDWAIFDCERQKDCPVRREVLVKLWQALEEAAPPCA